MDERNVVKDDRADLDDRRTKHRQHPERMPGMPDRYRRAHPNPFRTPEPAKQKTDQSTPTRHRDHRCQHA